MGDLRIFVRFVAAYQRDGIFLRDVECLID
jgi:hypothetical protein